VRFFFLQTEQGDDEHRLSRLSPPRRACSSGGHQEAGLPDAAAVEAILAIALFPARTAQKNEPHPGEALWLLSPAWYGILRTEQRKDFKRKVGIIPLFCLPGSFFCHVAASGTKPEER
jgi:hypothetical protein